MTTEAGYITTERLRPGSPTVQWPPVPDPYSAIALALLKQLETAHGLPAEDVLARQQSQLTQLITVAARSAPYYRNVLGGLAGQKLSGANFHDIWRAIPVVTAAEVQNNRLQFSVAELPREHGGIVVSRVALPDGTMVRLKSTLFPNLIGRVVQLAMMRAYGWDLGARLMQMGRASGTAPSEEAHWGLPLRTGPALRMPGGAPAALWAERLAAFRPNYMAIGADEFARLHPAFESDGLPDELDEILVIGSTAHRAKDLATATVRRQLIVPGFGAVAVERPDGRGFWLQPAATFCEVLDAEGRPAARGAEGRLVATSLHNFAMPVLRLDLGLRATLISDPEGTAPATLSLS